VDKKHMKSLTRGLVVVPNAAADLSTVDTWVYQIVVANIDSSGCTFKVTDKQGSPLELIPTVTLGATTVTVYSFPEGVLMKSGVNWVAGTANKLRAEVVGYQIVGS